MVEGKHGIAPGVGGQEVVERSAVSVGDVDAGHRQVGGKGTDGGQVPKEVEQEAGHGEKEQKKEDGFLPCEVTGGGSH